MTERNLRGAYVNFHHDRAEDWDFLSRWQPSVVRLMVHGSHTDPRSISLDKIRRVHETCPDALILLRCWDVDDRNYEAHAAMVANPVAEAQKQVSYWALVFDYLENRVPRNQLMAGLNNEPHPDKFPSLFDYTQAALVMGKHEGVRLGWGVFSTGNPPLGGEGGVDMDRFARLEELSNQGKHALILHEYAQPEGSRAVWIDEQGNERGDWLYLMGRHRQWNIRTPIIIGEWGIDGLLYNRHRDPVYGNSGWRNFPEWSPARYADEYVDYIQAVNKNVIAVCPFITDYADKKWASFDTLPAHEELLKRKDRCVRVVEQMSQVKYLPSVKKTEAKKEPVTVVNKQIVEPRVAQAILQIESGGQTHGPLNRIIIRFEPHIFAHYVDGNTFADYFYVGDPAWRGEHHRYRETPDTQWKTFHGDQMEENNAFALACRIDREAACKSISMGAAQIMGFNHARVGYPSAQAMYDSFQSAPMQVIGFINYFLSDPDLLQALHNKDWRTIATKYNGTGQVDRYSYLLQNAYNQLGGA